MRRLLIGCVLVLILLASVGCGPSKGWKEYYDLFESYSGAWDDAKAIANSTSRIGLAGPVGELQNLRREWKSVEVPEGLEKFHNKILDYEESTIEGFLAFMSDKPDDTVSRHFETASNYLKEAFKLLPEGFYKALGE